MKTAACCVDTLKFSMLVFHSYYNRVLFILKIGTHFLFALIPLEFYLATLKYC
jgi:hypothetical protein